MKTKIQLLSLFIALNMGIWIIPQKASAQDGTVSFQVFYDELSPYGQWVNYPGRGYVWIPNATNFTPYSSSGHWLFTNEGLTWVSGYSWGWIPFHYGRWNYDSNFGWMWTPGKEWGPAWVSWIHANGYYGWAALGLDDSIGYAGMPVSQWRFVKSRYLVNLNMSCYYSPKNQNATYINGSTAFNNKGEVNFSSPGKEEIENSTDITLTPVSIKSLSRPGQSVKRNELSIYRPAVLQSTFLQPAPAPAKFVKLNDLAKRTNTAQTKPKVQSFHLESAPRQPQLKAQPAFVPYQPMGQIKIIPNEQSGEIYATSIPVIIQTCPLQKNNSVSKKSRKHTRQDFVKRVQIVHNLVCKMNPPQREDSIVIINHFLLDSIRSAVSMSRDLDSINYLKTALRNALEDSLTVRTINLLVNSNGKNQSESVTGDVSTYCLDLNSLSPVDSVHIEIFRHDSLVAISYSKIDGFCKIYKLAPGEYTLTFSRNDYTPFTNRWIKVTAGNVTYLQMPLTQNANFYIPRFSSKIWSLIIAISVSFFLIVYTVVRRLGKVV